MKALSASARIGNVGSAETPQVPLNRTGVFVRRPAGGGIEQLDPGAFTASDEARGLDYRSLLLSFMVSGIILSGFAVSSEDYAHWFVVPVFLCGFLIGYDAVRWLTKRTHLLDLYGILGLVGVHFFFLAPLLHVKFNYWMPYVDEPSDWRPWLGRMALINVAAILAYFFGRSLIGQRPAQPPRSQQTKWVIQESRFLYLLMLFGAVSVALQSYVYLAFGGISGYIAAYSNRAEEASFQGLGWIFMFSEALPMLLVFGFVIKARRSSKQIPWSTIALVLIAFVVLKVFFGGLRGSRANYVWPAFWTIGLIHLWIRPLSRRIVLVGVLLLVSFMYAYGYYKSFGQDALTAIADRGALQSGSSAPSRSFESILLGDLGRSDVQAFLLYRLDHDASGSDYELSWGRTYAGSTSLLIPSSLWPDRPPHKVKEGTQAVYGMAAWDSGHFRATFAYGLAGETMLNFGPYAVALTYFFFGLLVAVVRRWSLGLSRDDGRVLLVPFALSVCLYLLLWDSDVTLFYLFTSGLLPVCILLASSTRVPETVGSRGPHAVRRSPLIEKGLLTP